MTTEAEHIARDHTRLTPGDKSPRLRRALDRIERAGNRLPHPATLFVILALLVVVLSALLSAAGVVVTHPGTGERTGAVNLISADGLARLINGFVPNFLNFPPFGPVVVSLLGLSVAEHSGFLGAVVRVTIQRTPGRMLTLIVVFAGAMSHSAGDVGYVLLLPLSAAIFHSAGRNPLAGLAAAFAGVSGGFAANVLLSPTDLVVSGLTQEAARIVDSSYSVTPLASWYFLAASVILVTVTGTLVTERIVEPRLGPYMGIARAEPPVPLGSRERRALAIALATVAFLAAAVAIGLIPGRGFLLDREQPGILSSLFVRGLVFWIFVFGFLPGLVYGLVAGTIGRDADIYRGMQKNIEAIAGYVVIVFFIAQFIAIFNWSNLGLLLAVSGADALRALSPGPIPLLVTLVLLTATIDLVIGSSSAKWAMLAPIIVPMFMLLGYSPELIQTGYRVGDSLTNIITPLSSNFPLVLLFFQRYMPQAGIGTVTATMLPYTAVNLVAWTLMLVLWVVAGLPTGPGAPLYLPDVTP